MHMSVAVGQPGPIYGMPIFVGPLALVSPFRPSIELYRGGVFIGVH